MAAGSAETASAAPHAAANDATCGTLKIPAGKCRPAVREFAPSSFRSANRLNAIAALRAKTMQRRIPTISCQRTANRLNRVQSNGIPFPENVIDGS
jgi:hypothetical protein